MKKSIVKQRLFIKIMKITLFQFILAFVFSSFVTANNVAGQGKLDTKITITISDMKLSNALSKIERKANVKFSYNSRMAQLAQRINVDVTGESLSNLLARILTPLNIKYSELSNRIILQKESISDENFNESEEISDITIKGKVTDDKGLPLVGVTVLVKNSKTSTITDIDGNYTITTASESDILVFSYIGFIKVEEAINGRKEINISLKEESNKLDEVVIQVGYGSVKKKDAIGAVSEVTAAKLNQGALVDPIQALQGKAAGVTITKQGGDPNSGFDVRIRGAAGFAAGGSPLYVVDGIRGIDPTTIAPEDILSYDILKDAASTAIYGADGANGVVFITTKRGKEGKTTIEFNTYIAIDKISKKLDFLSAKEYRDYTKLKGMPFLDLGGNTDWQNEISRTGISSNYNFAISGGSESSSYRASLTHTNMEGVIGKSGKERTTGKLNVTQKSFNNKLVIDFGLSGTMEKNNYVNYGGTGRSHVLFQAYQRLPTVPVYNTDGTLLEVAGVDEYFNPMHSVNNIKNKRDAKFLNGNLGLNLEIIKGLNAKVVLSYIREDWEKTYFEPTYKYAFVKGPPATIYEGYGNREYNNKEQSMIEATLTYKKTFSDVHNLTLLGGYSYRLTGYDGFKAEGNNPISNIIGEYNLLDFDNIQLGNSTSFKSSRKDIGYFFRAMYDYDSKYYVAGIIRRDGSSVFGANNQWGYFPSVQVAWNVARENFIADNISSVLNNLKLRASWGISGNSNIPVDAKDLKVSPRATVDVATGGKPITNFAYSNNGNPNLKWDKNTEFNLGVDFGLFNDRVTGSFEYYNKTISNMLIANTNVPIETNFSNTTFINGGELQNKGIEATLNVNVINRRDFSWNTTLVYTQNKQLVNALGNNQYNYSYLDVNFITGPGLIGISTQRMQQGYELGTFFGQEFAGFSKDGKGKWLVKDNNGKVKYLTDATTADKKVIGHALPKFEMGWSNYLKYKKFDLSLSFRAVYGNDIYNGINQIFDNPNQIGTRNVNHEALALNDEGVKEGAFQSISYFVENGSFIKLDNVNIGYNFINSTFLKFFNKIRLYASVNNVFTLTKYKGVDPEVNFSGGKDNKEIYFGTDQFNIYPKTRTITFGLNLIF